MCSPHVLIIGGGIGGLSLAQGLRKHNIPFTVFERDATPISRAQGYRVRVSGSGAEALYDCLDDEHWDLFGKSCAAMQLGMSGLNALDGSKAQVEGPSRGGSLHHMAKNNNPKIKPPYTVDRTMFRALLLLDQEGNVKFGKSFTHYELTPNGVKASFADGTNSEGTLLVGADGVASLVRKQFLPNIRYVDTGLRSVYGKTPITPELETTFNLEATKHMTIIKEKDRFLLFLEPVRFPSTIPEVTNNKLPQMQDYVYWVFGGNTEDMASSDEEFRRLSGKEAAELTKRLAANWHQSFKPLFELQNDKQAAPLRLLSAKPEKPAFPTNSKVTLLGDAVHGMMPAGGSGANVALADAALLLKLLVEAVGKGEGVSEEVLTKFWDGMWEIALPAIEGSAIGGAKLFGFKGFEGTKEVDL
ncbi:related to 2-polyprenyl-6-methoxyphenol hydroxylase and related FAD-dependent oxidoreductases [Phialocephala subalpina]|uniref:Related to 2-polyprenyl-6-methoxyphenol hydroxylase and related FAD-dependent oxidoreductases n=1 Tax=Phialocephala subalpina TaxID=576137 RepID=A0A1L7X989_9HELO|nr:related to 2-polyprenyl-6-methoxyphenol hydroxylase and related FAD-dependent oxidoreductases [Phialocephala subalpina]